MDDRGTLKIDGLLHCRLVGFAATRGMKIKAVAERAIDEYIKKHRGKKDAGRNR